MSKDSGLEAKHKKKNADTRRPHVKGSTERWTWGVSEPVRGFAGRGGPGVSRAIRLAINKATRRGPTPREVALFKRQAAQRKKLFKRQAAQRKKEEAFANA